MKISVYFYRSLPVTFNLLIKGWASPFLKHEVNSAQLDKEKTLCQFNITKSTFLHRILHNTHINFCWYHQIL
jgi:hypothetical protein